MPWNLSHAALAMGLSVALLAGVGATARADDEAAEVELLPRWKAGETRTYERVKARRRVVEGKETARGSGRGTIEVRIVEARADGYLVRWSIGETHADDPKAAQDPIVREMSKLIEGTALLLELDAEASITGLRNWEELKDSAGAMVETMVRNLRSSGVDPKAIESTRAALVAMFATKPQVEQLFLREPQVFFAAVGRAYPQGQPLEYEDQLPNPLGGAPFPCRGRMELKSLDEATGRAVVTWNQSVDPEAALGVMAETLKKMAERMGREPPNSDELRTLTVADRAEFTLDAKSGWVEEFSHTRTVKTEKGSQEDTLTMKQIAPR